MRKIAILVLSLLLTVAMFGVAAPGVSAHGNQACLDGDARTFLSGTTDSSPNYGRTGVKAAISLRIDICSTGADDDSLTAAWIGLAPRLGSGASQIVQMGILACREGPSIPGSVCNTFPGQIRYFYAFGGCTALTGPYGRDAGPADLNPHTYRIERTASDFVLYFPNGTTIFIDRGNISVSCFAAGNLRAEWETEKWDRGDSSGSVSARTTFSAMQQRNTFDSSFHNINKPIGNCSWVMATAPHNSACTMGGNGMQAWD